MVMSQLDDHAIVAQTLQQPMKRALDNIRAHTDVSLAFGGVVDVKGAVHLSSFSGQTMGALRGTNLTPGDGLGGRAAALRRGITVNDYFGARGITHRYDGIIRAEGLRSLVAVPVIVERQVVAMVYGAQRNADLIGGRIEDAVGHEVRALEQSIVRQGVATSRADDDALQLARLREQLRDVYRGLRDFAVVAGNPEVRDGLTRLADRLLDSEDPSSEMPTTVSPLTRREKDVLALAGAGLPNASIADTLGLTLYTVKSYMKSAMAKLGGATRLQAVVAARSQGLIP